ncbi:hypothetical protein Esi_0074_0008 [Ectocarpus siliculosus]|uniref:Uncharacterized protein n=1 Tax=Ectocarpus siliculosus TaxID=2880 RepID=D8LSI4_ECTSI|nr:hypothetical protein Esi_0074_0008 [Ectocarpus siliculosus]|eukprot:CBN77821.1 hypothetical protein Esi_0074_0008 [Ectocarpus siliculosus]
MLPGSYVFDVVTNNFGALERVSRSKYRLVCVAQESRSALDGRRVAMVIRRSFPDLTVVLLLDDDDVRPRSPPLPEKAERPVSSKKKRAACTSSASTSSGNPASSSTSLASIPLPSTLASPPLPTLTLTTPFGAELPSPSTCRSGVFPDTSMLRRHSSGGSSAAGAGGGGGGGGLGSIGAVWPNGGSLTGGLAGNGGVMDATGTGLGRGATGVRGGTRSSEAPSTDGFAASWPPSGAATGASLRPAEEGCPPPPPPPPPCSPSLGPSLVMDLGIVDYVLKRPFSDETFRLLLEAAEKDHRRLAATTS